MQPTEAQLRNLAAEDSHLCPPGVFHSNIVFPPRGTYVYVNNPDACAAYQYPKTRMRGRNTANGHITERYRCVGLLVCSVPGCRFRKRPHAATHFWDPVQILPLLPSDVCSDPNHEGPLIHQPCGVVTDVERSQGMVHF